MPNYGTEPLAGGQLLPGSTQAPLSEISGIGAPAESTVVDPGLPVVDVVYTNGQQQFVKIPKYRIVAMKPTAVEDDSAGTRPYLTLAGPADSDPNPIGVAAFNLLAEFPNRPQLPQSTYHRQVYIRYPFVNRTVGSNTLYNSNLNGTLLNGDMLAPDTYGRPVKFVPKKTITVVGVLDANGKVNVSAANIRYAPISNVSATKTNGTALGITSTDWVTDKYVVDTDGAQNDVVVVTIDFGHSATKMYGQVGRISTGRDLNSLAGWLRRDLGTQFPFAPMVNPMLTTQVVDQVIILDPSVHSTDPSEQAFDSISVTDVNSDGTWVRVKLPHSYIDPTRTISVQYSQNGTDYVTLSNAELTLLYTGQDIGAKFSVQPANGIVDLRLSGVEATTSSKIKVTYSYDFVYPHAAFGGDPNLMYNAGTGIKYLTDGTWTAGLTNVPPNAAMQLDGAGGYASLAMAKKSGLMHILVF